jgi:hypothetical protein
VPTRYVRVRKIDNDLERIQRQQGFLRALTDEMLSVGTLADPVATLRTASEIGSALTADEGLGIIDLGRVAWGLRGLASGGAVTATVPATPATRGGAAVLLPDTAAAEELFAGFRDGSAIGATTGAARVDRSAVPVTVLNGAGITGAAGETADALAAAGWTVAGVGNTDPRDATTIRYPPDLAAAAELLAQDLPTTVAMDEDPTTDGITLLLGTDAAD